MHGFPIPACALSRPDARRSGNAYRRDKEICLAMQLIEMLHKLGDRLGIVELAPAPQSSAPVKIQTRTVTLAELVTTIQITEVRELAQKPTELPVPFDEVYKAAGIAESG